MIQGKHQANGLIGFGHLELGLRSHLFIDGKVRYVTNIIVSIIFVSEQQTRKCSCSKVAVALAVVQAPNMGSVCAQAEKTVPHITT